MRNWSPVQLGLLAVAVLVFAGVAVLGAVALTADDDLTCVEGDADVGSPIDRPAEEALGAFVGQNPDLWPLEGWEVGSSDGDRTVFTNDDGGEYEVVVEAGQVRSFERCEPTE